MSTGTTRSGVLQRSARLEVTVTSMAAPRRAPESVSTPTTRPVPTAAPRILSTASARAASSMSHSSSLLISSSNGQHAVTSTNITTTVGVEPDVPVGPDRSAGRPRSDKHRRLPQYHIMELYQWRRPRIPPLQFTTDAGNDDQRLADGHSLLQRTVARTCTCRPRSDSSRCRGWPSVSTGSTVRLLQEHQKASIVISRYQQVIAAPTGTGAGNLVVLRLQTTTSVTATVNRSTCLGTSLPRTTMRRVHG